MMNESGPELIGEEGLVQRYEDIRRTRTLEGGHRHGRALLIHRGKVVWIQAWSKCVPFILSQSSSSCCPGGATVEQRTLESALPDNVEVEVVSVLASMAWAISRSVCHEK